MSDNRLIIAPAPFIHSGNTIQKIMIDFVVALLPAVAVGFLLFGPRVFVITAVCIATAVVCDMACQKFTARPLTPGDFHAVYLGFIFAVLMPPTAPLWAPAVGVAVAIIIGKHFFGGIGTNPFNPALVGLLVIDLSWHDDITRWVAPGTATGDALVKYAETPLEILQKFGPAFVQDISLNQLFMGHVPGPIGVCVAAILLGGIFLAVRRRICLCIPISFLLGVYGFAFYKWSGSPEAFAHPAFHIMSGTVMLGAFFLATDYPSSPVTLPGKIIFGLGCGIMTMLIRIYGVYPDGVALAILVMNLLSPILDRIKPRVIGAVKGAGADA